MFNLTTLNKLMTDAKLRVPMLHRACWMSQRTFFRDRESHRFASEFGVYVLRPADRKKLFIKDEASI